MMLLLFLAPLAVFGDNICNFLELETYVVPPTVAPTVNVTNITTPSPVAPTPQPVQDRRRFADINPDWGISFLRPDGSCSVQTINGTDFSESFSCDGSDAVYTQYANDACSDTSDRRRLSLGNGTDDGNGTDPTSDIVVQVVLAEGDLVSTLADGDFVVAALECSASDCYSEVTAYADSDCTIETDGVNTEVLPLGFCGEMLPGQMIEIFCCDDGSGVNFSLYEGTNCTGEAVETHVVAQGGCDSSDDGMMHLGVSFNCTGTAGTAAEMTCVSDDGSKTAATMTGGQIAAVVIFTLMALAATCYCVYTGRKLGGAVPEGSSGGTSAPLNPEAAYQNGYAATENTE